MKTKYKALIMVIISIFLVASCASGPNPLASTYTEKPAGFLFGLWHGFISLFAFIISIFSDKVNIYEVYNNGGCITSDLSLE